MSLSTSTPQNSTFSEALVGSDAEALRVYQTCLDTIDTALRTKDWTLCHELYALPIRLAGPDIDRMIEDRETFETVMKAAQANLEASGVTDFHRIAKHARFETGDRIVGRHESYMLRGGTLLMPPYAGYARIVRRGEAWVTVSLFIDKPDSKLPLFQADRIRVKPL